MSRVALNAMHVGSGSNGHLCIVAHCYHLLDCTLRPRCRLVRCPSQTAVYRLSTLPYDIPELQLAAEDCSAPIQQSSLPLPTRHCSRPTAAPGMLKSREMRSRTTLLILSSATDVFSDRRTLLRTLHHCSLLCRRRNYCNVCVLWERIKVKAPK